ncbi:hypothetical protein RSA31_17465 [Pantoea dispersa]|nr:hypothetical protein NS215_03115 [Pantoea dispersa]KTS86563.1 hypothetical protein RSA31_17465 [Pantoea dispersa]
MEPHDTLEANQTLNRDFDFILLIFIFFINRFIFTILIIVLILEWACFRNSKVVGSTPIIGTSNLYLIDLINIKFI